MKNKVISITLSLLILGLLFLKIVTMPPELKNARLVEIPEGAVASDIALILQDKGVIKRANWFLYLTNKYNVQEKMQAGIYEFSGRTSLRKVIDKIVHGDIVLIKITVPEGWSIKEIADLLERKELVLSEDFIKYALEDKNLEGMLFPDTYFFPHNVSIEAIAGTMYWRFQNLFEEIYEEKITDANFKRVKEIVTVASIVEKEAMHKEERAIIAGIIYKRLKRNMLLQSCSTVIYALGTPKSRLASADLKIKSPYNTYIHKGLPPGPICNPGYSSLKAALNPKDTEYLFFVAKGDGSNHFSKTYREHLEASKNFLDKRPAEEKIQAEE